MALSRKRHSDEDREENQSNRSRHETKVDNEELIRRLSNCTHSLKLNLIITAFVEAKNENLLLQVCSMSEELQAKVATKTLPRASEVLEEIKKITSRTLLQYDKKGQVEDANFPIIKISTKINAIIDSNKDVLGRLEICLWTFGHLSKSRILNKASDEVISKLALDFFSRTDRNLLDKLCMPLEEFEFLTNRDMLLPHHMQELLRLYFEGHDTLAYLKKFIRAYQIGVEANPAILPELKISREQYGYLNSAMEILKKIDTYPEKLAGADKVCNLKNYRRLIADIEHIAVHASTLSSMPYALSCSKTVVDIVIQRPSVITAKQKDKESLLFHLFRRLTQIQLPLTLEEFNKLFFLHHPKYRFLHQLPKFINDFHRNLLNTLNNVETGSKTVIELYPNCYEYALSVTLKASGLKEKFEARLLEATKIENEFLQGSVNSHSIFGGDRYIARLIYDYIPEAPLLRTCLQLFTPPPELKMMKEEEQEVKFMTPDYSKSLLSRLTRLKRL